jgi:hypothetical protein
MRVTAYIHDFDAMDEYLLSQPTRRNPHGLTQAVANPVAAGLVDNRSPRVMDVPLPRWQPAASTAPTMSVADLRTKHAQEQNARAQEALDFFERGKKAETAGKLNVARTYYQMAERRAADPLKAQIVARLKLIEGTSVAARQ